MRAAYRQLRIQWIEIHIKNNIYGFYLTGYSSMVKQRHNENDYESHESLASTGEVEVCTLHTTYTRKSWVLPLNWSIYLNVVCPIWLQYWGLALSNIRILILFRDNNKNLKAKLNQVKPNNIQPEETTNFLPTGRVKWIVQKVVLTLCTLSKTLEGNRMETCCNLY